MITAEQARKNREDQIARTYQDLKERIILSIEKVSSSKFQSENYVIECLPTDGKDAEKIIEELRNNGFSVDQFRDSGAYKISWEEEIVKESCPVIEERIAGYRGDKSYSHATVEIDKDNPSNYNIYLSCYSIGEHTMSIKNSLDEERMINFSDKKIYSTDGLLIEDMIIPANFIISLSFYVALNEAYIKEISMEKIESKLNEEEKKEVGTLRRGIPEYDHAMIVIDQDNHILQMDCFHLGLHNLSIHNILHVDKQINFRDKETNNKEGHAINHVTIPANSILKLKIMNDSCRATILKTEIEEGKRIIENNRGDR